jgi:hypothetical protein
MFKYFDIFVKASDQHEPRFRQSSDCLIKATVLQKVKLGINNVSNSQGERIILCEKYQLDYFI